jgi:RimJ/RimL family protein N-acetyltransferase
VKHDHRLEGEAFAIRPVTLDDAQFIWELRGDLERSRYLHPVEGGVSAQVNWMEAYFDTPDDYYFLVERLRDGRPEGTAGLYGVDSTRHCAEWGRWVLRRDSLAAIESALLIYRFGFDRLGLEEVYCRTLAANRHVVGLHQSLGLATRERSPAPLRVGGEQHELVEQFLTATAWRQIQDAFQVRAAGAARLLAR